MQFIKKNIWTLAAMVLFVSVAMVGDVMAGDPTSLMSRAQGKVRNVFEAVRTIIFILGGFGLVGVAFAAIFGKINWKWFAGLAVGLAILAAANAVVQYAAGAKANTGVTDTFQ
jgi:hypothetical protein